MATLSPRTLAAVGWSALHTLQFGYHVAALNGISDVLTCGGGPVGGGMHFVTPPNDASWFPKPPSCIPMTDYEFGAVTAIFTLGGLIGSLTAGHVLEKHGPKAAQQLSSTIVLLGSLLMFVSPTYAYVLLARLLIGVGCGFATVSVPRFLSEVGPAEYKNRLGIANQFFIVLGVFFTQSIAIPLSKPTVWRVVPLISALISVISLIGSLAVQESPVWLKHNVKARQFDVEDQEDTALLNNKPNKPQNLSIWQLIKTDNPAVKQGFIIVVFSMIAQQLCGISPVMYYSTKIMGTVFPTNAKIIALLIAGFKIPVTFTPALLLKHFTPKQLLVTSAACMSFFALILAVCMNSGWAIPSSVAIIAFVMCFSFGLGPVAWVVIGDVMPAEAASAAGSLGIGINWSTNFLMGLIFLPLRDILKGLPFGGVGNIFYLFAFNCFLLCRFLAKDVCAYEIEGI